MDVPTGPVEPQPVPLHPGRRPRCADPDHGAAPAPGAPHMNTPLPPAPAWVDVR